MEKGVLFLCIVCVSFALISAKPIPLPENYDEELLAPKDTLHYPYLFWLGRPFYAQDDDGDNTYYQPDRRSSTISYANVGAGWGR
ncbi:PREDICTED: uncharacterized protein LOC108555162 [Eufriesea mexicana]|uniref:uncharacterized protein LOC108555162 n=1 Tax=Eufriesea mexicana TaxID=516756 RepID=UPI00083C9032|nr:PREDICTED: uncharacterized protein LOC108555162 [Eufriesea mexicana]